MKQELLEKIDDLMTTKIGVAFMLLFMYALPGLLFYCIFGLANNWGWLEWTMLVVGSINVLLNTIIGFKLEMFAYILGMENRF